MPLWLSIFLVVLFASHAAVFTYLYQSAKSTLRLMSIWVFILLVLRTLALGSYSHLGAEIAPGWLLQLGIGMQVIALSLAGFTISMYIGLINGMRSLRASYVFLQNFVGWILPLAFLALATRYFMSGHWLAGFLYLVPVIAWARFWSRLMSRGPEMFRERLLGPKGIPKKKDGIRRIWLHAVSVGEVVAAEGIVRALNDIAPDVELFVSITTPEGVQRAKQSFGDTVNLFTAPVDFTFPVRRCIDSIKPDVYVCMETERWLNTWHLLKKQGVPIIVANGRISDAVIARGSFSDIPRALTQKAFSLADRLLMQSEQDVERVLTLGVPHEKVTMTGNTKFDVSFDHPADEIEREIKSRFGLGSGARVIVAGSTHPGEESAFVEAVRSLEENIVPVVAPRQVQRSAAVKLELQEKHPELKVILLAEAGEGTEFDILVVDRIGLLMDLYAVSEAAFVGGTLFERGGHNMLEPVLRGTPVIFGPSVNNFVQIAGIVSEAGVGRMLDSAGELSDGLRWALERSSDRAKFVDECRTLVDNLSGAALETARVIQENI